MERLAEKYEDILKKLEKPIIGGVDKACDALRCNTNDFMYILNEGFLDYSMAIYTLSPKGRNYLANLKEILEAKSKDEKRWKTNSMRWLITTLIASIAIIISIVALLK